MSVRKSSAFDRDGTPNVNIDQALEELMKDINNREKTPADVAVKIINAAIQWERVKHQIENKDDEFDPDNPT